MANLTIVLSEENQRELQEMVNGLQNGYNFNDTAPGNAELVVSIGLLHVTLVEWGIPLEEWSMMKPG